MSIGKVYSFVGNDIDELSKLKEQRGLTDADLDRLHITIVPITESKHELGWSERCSLVKIPYFGITGEKLLDNRGEQLARYRRVVANDKGERYTQRRGTGSRHYLPLGIDWHAAAADATVDLYYTEGEFKAISSCKHLGPTVANAGVTSWRGPDGGLAAPLNDFVWKGRNVYIVYDAESTSTKSVPLKANISKALGELAVDLQVRGARVRSLLIAKTSLFEEGTKLGVDDYFAKGGTREELLATGVDPDVDEDWARMFRLYAVFRGTKPHIKNIDTGEVYSGKEFADYIETRTRIRDGKPVKIANIYREHDDRNEFSQYVFDPELPSGFLRDEKKFNTWQGFAVKPKQSINYDQTVLDYVQFQSGIWGVSSDYFLDWTAHLFQRPWELTSISPILVSRVKGIGKSLTGAIVRALIGTRSSFVGGVDGLTEKHTGELEGKVFVQVDEADALFSGKEERLKALDSDEIRIRKMNTDGYTIRNIMRKFYTTNKEAAFRIAADERRYYVVRATKTADDGVPGAAWNTWVRGVIAPMLRDPEALGDLMYFFMTRDISGWDPMAPVPRTEAMMDMVEAGESKKTVMAEQLYSQLSESGVWAVDAGMMAIDNKLWGEVKAILLDNGGRSVGHIYKTDGMSKRTMVWMTRKGMLPIEEDTVKGARLVTGCLGADQIRTMLLKTRATFDTVRALVESSKY